MKTFNSFAQRIQNLFGEWHAWAGPDVHDGPLTTMLPVTVSAAIAHGTQVTSLLIRARAIRDSDGFAAWAAATDNTDQASDLVDDFIPKLEAAEKAFQDVTHHENVWSRATLDEKQRLAHMTVIDADTRKHLNAHVQLKKPLTDKSKK